MCVTAVGDRAFRRLCAALGRDDLAADPRFAGADGRRERREELGAALEAALAGLTTEVAVARLDAAGVACEAVAPRCYLPELFFQPWALETQRVFAHDHPAHGPDP